MKEFFYEYLFGIYKSVFNFLNNWFFYFKVDKISFYAYNGSSVVGKKEWFLEIFIGRSSFISFPSDIKLFCILKIVSYKKILLA
jgi:hypothetical protein